MRGFAFATLVEVLQGVDDGVSRVESLKWPCALWFDGIELMETILDLGNTYLESIYLFLRSRRDTETVLQRKRLNDYWTSTAAMMNL